MAVRPSRSAAGAGPGRTGSGAGQETGGGRSRGFRRCVSVPARSRSWPLSRSGTGERRRPPPGDWLSTRSGLPEPGRAGEEEGESLVTAGRGGDVQPRRVNILEGSTFVVSDPNGDICAGPDEPAGLFYRDMRHLSRWEVRLNGNELEALTGEAVEYDEAVFFLVEPTGT